MRLHDLTGEQFGELLVIRPLKTRRTGNVVWLCRCLACGSDIARDARRLLANRGYVQACFTCARERYRGDSIIRHQQFVEYLVELFEDTGSLYSSFSMDRLLSELQQELIDQHGPVVEAAPALADLIVREAYEPHKRQGRQQRAAFLLPIGTPAAQWQCADCNAAFCFGFFCGACHLPTCRDCVSAECHICDISLHCEQHAALTRQVLQEAYSYAIARKDKTPTTLLPLVPKHQQQLRARECRDVRSRLSEAQVIELAKTRARHEREKLACAIRASNEKRWLITKRAERKRLKAMPPSVRRIVSDLAEGAEKAWVSV